MADQEEKLRDPPHNNPQVPRNPPQGQGQIIRALKDYVVSWLSINHRTRIYANNFDIKHALISLSALLKNPHEDPVCTSCVVNRNL